MSTADTPPSRRNDRVWLVGVAALVGLAALTFAFWPRGRQPAPEAEDEVARLTKQLGHTGPPAVAAATALGEKGEAAAPAVPALCRCLARDRTPELRFAAADSLGKIGRPALPDALAAVRPRDFESDDVRPRVLTGLARSCYHDLLRAAGDKENESLRVPIEHALTSAPTPADLVPMFAERLRTGDQSAVEFAARALAKAGDAGHPHLLAGLKHPNEKVGRAVAAAFPDSTPLPAEAVPVLLDVIRSGREWRGVAVGLARAKGDLVPVLVRTLADPNPSLRRAACDALAQLRPKSDAAADGLFACLGDRETSSNAADALAVMGEIARPRLLAAAKDGPALVRVGAIRSLTTSYIHSGGGTEGYKPTDSDEDVTRAIAAALESPDREVRWAALEALRQRPGPKDREVVRAATEAISNETFSDNARVLPDALLWCVRNHPDWADRTVPRALLLAILRVHAREGEFRKEVVGVAAALSPLGEGGFIGLLADADAGVREQAGKLLGDLLALEDMAFGRYTNLVGLGMGWQRERAVQTILAGLRHADAAVRLRLVRAIDDASSRVKEWGTTLTIGEGMAGRLEDDDRDVRLAALKALSRYGSEKAPPALVGLAGDADGEVRVAAVGALAAVRRDESVVLPALVQALRHRDAATRRAAADGFARRWEHPPPDAAAAVAELIDALGDADKGVRAAAAAALGRAGPTAVAPLVKVLRHEKADIRDGAVAALALLGAVKELSAALDDKDAAARLGACQALERIGPAASGSAPALNRVAEGDENADVRTAAASALAAVVRNTEKK